MAANKTYKDPITSSERQVLFGRDAKAISDSLIGFINRDEQITSRLPVPAVTSSLGRDYMAQIKQRMPATSVLHTTQDYGKFMVNSVNSPEAVPGIMTLWFMPVVGDTNEEGGSVTHQSYLAKWMSARNLDNMTKNWQPGDMQFVDVALGYIKMYLSVATRALIIMRDVAQKSENKYYNKVAMLRAMGFYFTEEEVDLNFDSIWSYFNKSIVSFINSNAWLRYSYPGVNRWAALCEAIYRDTPAKTDYAQHYLFMPYRMVEFGEQYVDSKRIGWTMSWKKETGSPTVDASFKTRYAVPTVPVGNRGTQGFLYFLHDLADLIHFIFYNDDVKDIIATLNAIAARNLGNELSDSERFSFQRLDFTPDSDEMRAPILYDSAMLIAIHNATIMTGLNTGDVSVLSKSGKLDQSLFFDLPATSTSAAGGAGFDMKYAGAIQAYVPKVLNFPNFNPTQCDFINATQWTVSLSGASFSATISQTDTKAVPATAVGTDFICAADITTMDVVVTPGQGATGLKTDLSTFESYRTIPYYGIILSLANYNAAGDIQNYWGTANDPVQYENIYNSAFVYAQQFAMFPMAHEFGMHYASSYVNMYNFMDYKGPVVQSDVYYIADGLVLSAMHSQFKTNFWGYPIYNTGGSGSVDLTVGPDSTLYARDPHANE